MGTGGNNVPFVICRATQQGKAESFVECAPTLTAAAGMSGNNQPIVAIPVPKGCDLYNHLITDDTAATLTTAAGTSTGTGPSVMVAVPYEQQAYDRWHDSGCAATLKATGGSYGGGERSDCSSEVSALRALVEQGGKPMTYQEVVGTLCACDIKGAGSQYVNDDKCIVMKYPVPYTLKMRGGCEGG